MFTRPLASPSLKQSLAHSRGFFPAPHPSPSLHTASLPSPSLHSVPPPTPAVGLQASAMQMPLPPLSIRTPSIQTPPLISPGLLIPSAHVTVFNQAQRSGGRPSVARRSSLGGYFAQPGSSSGFGPNRVGTMERKTKKSKLSERRNANGKVLRLEPGETVIDDATRQFQSMSLGNNTRSKTEFKSCRQRVGTPYPRKEEQEMSHNWAEEIINEEEWLAQDGSGGEFTSCRGRAGTPYPTKKTGYLEVIEE